MTQAELLRYVASVFEDLGVTYMIGGSQASVYFGESRFTQDIDLVTDLKPEHIPSAVEELLRYESPSQHTARLAPADVEMGGKRIRERQAVIAVMGAANRDPERFPEPDRLDITRQDNRHLAFGWAAHF